MRERLADFGEALPLFQVPRRELCVILLMFLLFFNYFVGEVKRKIHLGILIIIL